MAASARKVFGFLIMAVAVAFGGGAIAQADNPPYKPEFLQKGFGVLENRVVEGWTIWTSQSIPNLSLTLDQCVEQCQAEPKCRSFTFNTKNNACELKANNTFFPLEFIDYFKEYVSGISMPSRDFTITPAKIVKSVYARTGVRSNGSPRDACAISCQNSELNTEGRRRCRAFSANPFPGHSHIAECRLSESNEFIDNTEIQQLVSGSPKEHSHDFVISDMQVIDGKGYSEFSDIDNIEKCAEKCKNGPECRSFVFRPSARKCELHRANNFSEAIRVFDVVSGVKSKFTNNVQAIYIRPNGKGREKAEEVILAAMKAVQEHYGKELGKTFAIDTPAVRTIDYNGRVALFESSDNNNMITGGEYDIHRFLMSLFGSDYMKRKNIIFVVAEGLAGTSYGTAGAVVIANEHWDNIYNSYNYETKKFNSNSENLVVWSHELGHVFGLNHWEDTLNCAKVNSAKGLLKTTAIMSPTANATLFENHFEDWEIQHLLGKTSAVPTSCFIRYPQTSATNIRPPSESYLRLDWPPKQ